MREVFVRHSFALFKNDRFMRPKTYSFGLVTCCTKIYRERQTKEDMDGFLGCNKM